jgi:MYXO-CTERM domain-containing protein
MAIENSRGKNASRPALRRSAARVGLGVLALLASTSFTGSANAKKPFMEYIKPMPLVSPLSSDTWGVAGVLPRDLSNGIESVKGAGVHPEYYYWDGQIIRAKDGKYHLFMSTFSGNTNFGLSWFNSDAYHAVSENNVLGPYVRKGYIYDNNGSHKGHNVSALELPDGKYAVIVSETVPFTIYTSSSLDGPWTPCQPTIQISASNVSLVARHDGRFQIVDRHGTIAISDTLCGTYVKQKPTTAYTQNGPDSIYPKRTSIPNVPNPTYEWQEDPHIWRSGGIYHVIYSGSGDRVGWHVYSEDGLHWEDNGYAWSPREYKKIFCYEGTDVCNQWYKMERPGVVLQNGHPTHITWAVSDVDKDNQVLPNSNHGTKIIVVPFDGLAFDKDFGFVDDDDDGAGGSDSGGAGSGGSGGGAGTAGTGGLAAGGTGGSPSGGAGGQGGTAGASTGAGGTTATGGSVSGGAGGQPTAGTSATGGDSGGSNAATTTDNEGCGCRVPGGPTPSKSLALLAFGALFGLRRSRRRSN